MGFLTDPIKTRSVVAPINTLTGWSVQARFTIELADDPLGELGSVLKLVAATSAGAGSVNYTWGSDQDFSGVHGFGLDMYIEKPIDTVSTDLLTYDSIRLLNQAQSTNMLIYDRPSGSNISPLQGRYGHQYHYLPMGQLVDTGAHNLAATRSIRLSFPVDHTVPTTIYIRGIYKDDLFKPAFGVRIDDVRDTGLTWVEDNIIDHYGDKYPITLAVAGSLTGTAGHASLSRLRGHVADGAAVCFNHTYDHNNLATANEATILSDYEAGRDYLDDNGLTTVQNGIRSSEICVLPYGAADSLTRQVLNDAGCKLIVGINAVGGNHRRHILGNNVNAAGEIGVIDRQIATGTGYQTTASYVTGNIKSAADSGDQTLLSFHDIATGATNPTTAVLALEAWSAISKRLRSNEADWCTPLDWAAAIAAAA